ncbi:MAG TPA: epoxide hydrolase [Acidimicrobiia bacterium]|nr:epoxide hydrolase [Acidimicrobiia bacterium]
MPGEVTEFRVAIADGDIADLRERLARTRWPERETVDDWSQGIPLAYTQDLCTYWAHDYDFAAAEARFNAFPQFRTELAGGGPEPLAVHFVHARSPHADALPLVLTHGWPGSVVEFQKVIGPLSDPTAHGGDAADAFHVVCPSLPGYGWSDKPTRSGWNVERIARAWIELMERLGYEWFGAQGGDWGAFVTTSVGTQGADRVAGIHVQLPIVALEPSMMSDLTEAEQATLDSAAYYSRWGSGYSTEQASRPQTVGYGLVDSPAAQCAWIVEKFWDWTDCDGHPEHVLSRDELLDNVMWYWLPAAGASSARLYWESFHDSHTEPVTVPSGCSIFPKEIFRPSRRWVETRFRDLRYFNEVDRGGHFAAFEQPEIFVDEVRSFFRMVR